MNIIPLKRIIIFVGLVIFAIGIGFLIYKLIWSRPSTTTTPNEPTPGQDINGLPTAATGTPNVIGGQATSDLTSEEQTGTTPSVTETTAPRENKINALSTTDTLAPVLTEATNKIRYYDKTDEKFYEINAAGEKNVLSDEKFNDAREVTWSPDKNKAVIVYPDDSKIIYDFKTNKQVTIPKHWENFSFNESGDQMVFKSIGTEEENSWIGVVNTDGTGAQAIEKIGLNAYKVTAEWSPNNQIVGTYVEATDANNQKIYFIGLNGENFQSLTVNGRGFQSKWSPTGSKLLYSVYSTNDKKMLPNLWITNASGDNIGTNNLSLGINTWPEKCVFISENEAYCGVPQNLPDGSGMFPMLSKDSSDDIYLINLTTGSKILVDDSGRFNIKNPAYSSEDKALYFLDVNEGMIKKLSLPAS
ncbi:MAG: hypothetical protein PHR00_03630 [Patescibacteria group bacterium]|nr:hypothetical protein [Patescibacteria group bacterium]